MDPEIKVKDVKRFFNQVEVLIHPFFSLEAIRDKKRGEMLKNATEKMTIAAYQELGIIEVWRAQLEKAKQNPNAILILIGLKEKERRSITAKPKNYFEEGLTKEKFQKFSTQYQSFLLEARKALGRRMIYITQGDTQNIKQSLHSLMRRGIVPARRVRINAYGEYYQKEDINTCVYWVSHNVGWLLERIQSAIFPDRKTTIKLTRWRRRKNQYTTKYLSLGSGVLYAAAAKRQFRQTGKITEEFVKKHRRFQRGINPKREAKALTRIYRRHSAKR